MVKVIKQSENESKANMSDEPERSEREQPQEQTPKWGDPISRARQVELDALVNRRVVMALARI
jgi:hypothetical protein